MSPDEEKKGIFGKAIDAFSSRDEKETISDLEAELEKAKKEAEEAKDRAKDLVSQNIETRVDKNKSNKALENAEQRIAELEKKLKDMLEKDRKEDVQKRVSKAHALSEKLEAEKKPAIITTHTVESNNQTLSHIALKYYKHATPPYWQYLLEHNKEVLNGSEKNVRMGMELVIPELPDELKD
jgi:septal ring factor EnvC (AmiA/AmiB activator)